MNLKKNFLWIMVLPFLILIFLLMLRLININLYFSLIKEDGLIENIQFFAYFIAGIIAIYTTRQLRRDQKSMFWILYGVFTLSLFFVAFEEISWGQRIFNIQTPEQIAKLNTQDEITVHNLEQFQALLHMAYIIVSTYAILGIYLLKRPSQKLFGKYYQYVLMNKSLIFYFLPVFLFYFYWDYIGPQVYIVHGTYFLDPRDQESLETLFSIGFLIFVLQNYQRVRNSVNK